MKAALPKRRSLIYFYQRLTYLLPTFNTHKRYAGTPFICTCFLMSIYKSRSFPLRANWRKSDCSVDGEPQGNWIHIHGISNKNLPLSSHTKGTALTTMYRCNFFPFSFCSVKLASSSVAALLVSSPRTYRQLPRATTHESSQYSRGSPEKTTESQRCVTLYHIFQWKGWIDNAGI